jgi:glycosyltransferase involved in cell wall biosynthesis
VLGQTSSTIEFAILNDGSTAGTEADIKRYLHDPRLKYHYQENIGQTMDRFDELNNRVVALSAGEYICAIGADDVYLPGRVERQLGEFLKNPGSMSPSQCPDIQRRRTAPATQFRHERALTFNRFNLLRWLFTVNFIAHPSVMIRAVPSSNRGATKQASPLIISCGSRPRPQSQFQAPRREPLALQGTLMIIHIGERMPTGCAAATIDVLESVYRSNSIDDFYREIALCSDSKRRFTAPPRFRERHDAELFFYLPAFAVREYEAALAVNTGGMEARNNLAVACAVAGDREKAGAFSDPQRLRTTQRDHRPQHLDILASDPQGNHRPDYRLLAESIGASELKTNVALVEKGAATAPGSTLPAGTGSAALGREQESASVCKTRKGHTTILIPSVDPGNDLKACLEAIDIHMDEPHDIIVIKNAGAVPKWLKQRVRSGNTIFIDVPASSGYAARCNRGMEKATGEYVLIIGEDTLLLKDSFSRMLHHLGGASNRGMVVPLANHALGTQKIPGAEDLSVDESQVCPPNWESVPFSAGETSRRHLLTLFSETWNRRPLQ